MTAPAVGVLVGLAGAGPPDLGPSRKFGSQNVSSDIAPATSEVIACSSSRLPRR